MSNAKQESAEARRVMTPECTLSYPHIFKPAPGPKSGQEGAGEDLKYSGAFVFDPGADLSALKTAAVYAAKEKWGSAVEEMMRMDDLKFPFRKDAERKGYKAGSVFLNARTNRKPGVVSRYADPATERAAIITDESEIYPGVRVRASLTAFAYDRKGNKGVSFALNNIQKMGDGERLDNRVAAEVEFEAELAKEAVDLDNLV